MFFNIGGKIFSVCRISLRLFGMVILTREDEEKNEQWNDISKHQEGIKKSTNSPI